MFAVSSQELKRQIIYQLDLHGDKESVLETLRKWRFVRNSLHQPVVAVTEGVLEVGSIDGVTFDAPPIEEIANCSVDCELRIIDDGGDLSRWAGVRVRGFQDNILFGYLIYLRSQGKVEIYRAGVVLAESVLPASEWTKEQWTKLRIDIFGSTIKVSVNEQQPLIVTDTRFSDRGRVYLHAYGVRAQIREFAIYQLVPSG
jgi:hypothetical protein